MKNKKIMATLLAASLILMNPVSAFANSNENEENSTYAVVCQFSRGYSETVSNEYNVEQWYHIAEKNSVVTDVTRNVTVTQSLSVTGGVEGNLNFLLANTKANFELSYEGSKATSVSITWKDIPAGETHRLSAGKKFVTVTGKKTQINSDCSSSQETTTVKGSVATYHTSVKQ